MLYAHHWAMFVFGRIVVPFVAGRYSTAAPLSAELQKTLVNGIAHVQVREIM